MHRVGIGLILAIGCFGAVQSTDFVADDDGLRENLLDLFRVVRFPGDSSYRLGPFGKEGVPYEYHLQALCLLGPEDVDVDVRGAPDTIFTSKIDRIQQFVSREAQELGTSDQINEKVRELAAQFRVPEYLMMAYERDLKSAESCLAQVLQIESEQLEVAIQDSRSLAFISLCPSPSERVVDHLFVHPGIGANDDSAARAKLFRHVDTNGLRGCLASVIEKRDGASRAVRAIDGDHTRREYKIALRHVFRAWSEFGVEEAIRAFEAGSEDQLQELLGRCRQLY